MVIHGNLAGRTLLVIPLGGGEITSLPAGISTPHGIKDD